MEGKTWTMSLISKELRISPMGLYLSRNLSTLLSNTLRLWGSCVSGMRVNSSAPSLRIFSFLLMVSLTWNSSFGILGTIWQEV